MAAKSAERQPVAEFLPKEKENEKESEKVKEKEKENEKKKEKESGSGSGRNKDTGTPEAWGFEQPPQHTFLFFMK